MSKIMAELKGHIGVSVLSIDFKAKFEKEEGSSESMYKIHIEAKSIGANFQPPANPSLDDVCKTINDFKIEVANQQKRVVEAFNAGRSLHAMQQCSPVAMTIDSLSKYAPTINEFEAAKLDHCMEQLSKTFYGAITWRAKVTAIQESVQRQFDESPKDRVQIYGPYSRACETLKRQLDQKIDECIQYRRKPFQQLVGIGCSPVRVPDGFPDGDVSEMNRAHGLCGEGYLPTNEGEFEGFIIDDQRGVQGKAFGNGKLTGQGKVYQGHWKYGKMHGKGKLKETNSTYNGQFQDGKKHGEGFCQYSNGDVYKGQWKDDKKDGKGKVTSEDGSSYEGIWTKDVYEKAVADLEDLPGFAELFK